MKNSVRRLASAAVLAALAIPATSYATNGYFSDAYSVKNGGLAGAGVALPEDAMASATNPAGMVWVGQQADIGAALFSPKRQYTVSGNTGNVMPSKTTGFPLQDGTVVSDKNLFVIPHFGMNWMIGNDSSAGVAVYGNGGMNTTYPSSAQGGAGTFYKGATGVNLEQLFVNGTYSRKINASSSWGVSLIAIYQTFKATGLGSFATSSSDANNLTDNGTDSSTGFAAKVGWQGEVAPGLTLGASYQSKATMSKFNKYKGLFANGGEFDIPATWTAGLAYKITPSSTLAFDVQQIDYSGVAAIANSIDELAVSGHPLGASNGAGFGWRDVTVYKLGYQWTTSPAWTWRVGYSHCKQPIPSHEVLFNILAPGVIEDEVTFGFTNKLSNTSNWSARLMYAPAKTVTGKNAMYTGETIALKMHEYQVGATYSWKF